MRKILMVALMCNFIISFAQDIKHSTEQSKSEIIKSTSDTLKLSPNQLDSIKLNDTIQQRKNIWQKFIGYFSDANKPKTNKKFDVNFIGGPHFSTDTKLGLGIAGAGLYRMDRNDTLIQPSNVSLMGDISTVGFYLVGIRGSNIFPKDKYRLNYGMYLYSFPSYYWGIGYENGNNNDNQTKLKRFQSKIKGEFLVKLAKNFYAGPVLTWDYVKGDNIDRPELLDGMDLCTRNYGFGLTFQYDSRDYMTNASRGMYIFLNQMFRPKWLWNDYAFNTTDFQFNYYQKAWKGSIIAFDLRTSLNFGNPSWAMMAKLGDSNSMRGYYEGRYRDKHMMSVQIELRQHIWRRNGIVVWAGTGTVFHDKQSFGHFLPNFGIGYRWEFKKKMNVRLDYGFGKKGQSGFIFQINEAF